MPLLSNIPVLSCYRGVNLTRMKFVALGKIANFFFHLKGGDYLGDVPEDWRILLRVESILGK
jgi:hypothetical protein